MNIPGAHQLRNPLTRSLRPALGRAAVRGVAMLAVVAATVLAAYPGTAAANHRSYVLDFRQIEAVEETDGLGSDEIYVIFFVGDRRGPGDARVMRTRQFNGVDTGETRTDEGHPRLWGFGGAGAPITNPDNLVILVAVMENDGSNPTAVTDTVRAQMVPAFLAYVAAGQGRATMVENLRRDMANAIAVGVGIGDPGNRDDRIGPIQELRLTNGNLVDADAGRTVDLSLRFRDSGEDATYRVWMRLRTV